MKQSKRNLAKLEAKAKREKPERSRYASNDAKESRALLRDANSQIEHWKQRAENAERDVRERDITIALLNGQLEMLERLGTIPPRPAGASQSCDDITVHRFNLDGYPVP